MNLYQQISSNKRKTWILMVGLITLIAIIVYVFALAWNYDPLTMVGIALVIAGVYTLISYYFSSSIITSIARAKEVSSKHDNWQLYTLVENLCLGAGLPRPKIYIINDPSPNAFATGRDPNHAIVCFTTGILEKLDRAELEGVVAHELSHIKNYDIRLTSLVVVLVGLIAILADIMIRATVFGGGDSDNRNRNGGGFMLIIGLVLALVSPLVASIIQMAVSRQREYLADASAAYLTRNPDGLARALQKISQDPQQLRSANNATSSLYISNPFKGKSKAFMGSLFDTHPPIAERIKRLRAM